ncbi:hypothetical protein FH972_022995 [Carpinus fangiana]|uniref:SSD domain-containing protein n=1 Tax=Carpinus fangiana TaxID=176857 RepID=A0A5N6KUE0_9ROSI|nr:hypothetical protein FH972_022995 [Carpinus fangiana]
MAEHGGGHARKRSLAAAAFGRPVYSIDMYSTLLIDHLSPKNLLISVIRSGICRSAYPIPAHPPRAWFHDVGKLGVQADVLIASLSLPPSPGRLASRTASPALEDFLELRGIYVAAMKFRGSLAVSLVLAGSWQVVAAEPEHGLTTIHEKGRCAMRGQCGSAQLFWKEVPCADNGKAEEPESDLRQKLVDICGDKWSDGPICCDDAQVSLAPDFVCFNIDYNKQVDALEENLKTVNKLISSCPACRENFYNLFCTFTCSPDQSTFVNVTDTKEKDDKALVLEVDNLWSEEYSAGFYDSCKSVKFGPTNTPAMNFIGGGAKNYSDFLKFLGTKKFLGSPFQINFPVTEGGGFPGMDAAGGEAIPCNTTDKDFRCTCVDCNSACTELPEVSSALYCHVGAWPCLSFSVVLVYSILVFIMVAAVTAHVAYRKHTQSCNDRLRLLQDSAPSDDEDDDDEIIYNARTPTRAVPQHYALNAWCDKLFSRLARTASRFPALTIGSNLVIVGLLSLGWTRFSIERDPVRLWVSPDSAAAEEKLFFDSNFGPFFRAEQAFLVNDTNPTGPGPVLSYDTLHWWFGVEDQVKRLKAEGTEVTLNDICYKPTGESCVIQSVSGYFQNEGLDRNSWQDKLLDCTSDPASCLPDFGLPLDPKLILGGQNSSYLDSSALVVTWVVSNDEEGTVQFTNAASWEKSMNTLLRSVQDEAHDRGLRVSFNTEISLEQELNKSTNTDAKIVVISYIIMFIYASLALGSTTLTVRSILRNPSTILVQSKFSLGVVGILIVLLSVSASVGLFSALGVKVTLIIAEVIPFLVLAVGVDNIFLIVHEFERVNATRPELPIEDRLAKALGRMGPSILLSASMETVAFALGAFVSMPAVRNFAAYAAGAVVINALLQVSMFVSVLALNQRRVEAGRADCVPCVRVKQPISLDDNPVHNAQDEDSLQRFIRRTYAPALLGRKAKVAILTAFLGLFTIGLALLPTVELGLDQRIAIPNDSYLIEYFNDLYDYFESGPPVYFVTRELNVTKRGHQEQLCGRFAACDEFSLSTIIEQESKRPEVSFLATAAASWVDDFFLWLNPEFDTCCVDGRQACFEDRKPPWNAPLLRGMPEGKEYMYYLQRWLKAPTNVDCPLGGSAPYSNAVVFDNVTNTILASHFRSAHLPLRSQDDFIQSYAAARRIATEIEESNPGLSVFPYSKHYIFFDQYSTIVRVTLALVGSAIAACFIISSLLLGSIRTGLVIAVTVTMTVVDIGGAMAIAGVSLNAVTLVNLVICVGIAVEFCAHIARAFQFPSASLLDQSGAVSSRYFSLNKATDNRAAISSAFVGMDARAWAAMSQVGGSVFSGITITKLLGVCVLAFTRSKIFEIYYFRVWLALVLLAASHALVLLPVLLSWLGGPKGEYS